jgi:hypothetical protein
MPEFESYIDVDPSDFVYSCSKREIKELIECLVEDGHLPKSSSPITEGQKNLLDIEWESHVSKLFENRLRLSKEEEEIIVQIASRL